MSGPLSPEELKEVESAIAMARSKQTPPPPAAPETDGELNCCHVSLFFERFNLSPFYIRQGTMEISFK